ncbi:spore maturation protein [Oscillibacter ruminantium]|uniref:spore maturation protein n=1 Tax=Oscillibacter ruminantium TaxID=1263547 RepID=UPI003332AF03
MFQTVLGTISDYAVPFLLVLIPLMGLIRRINVYAAFVDGAKEGFTTAVRIIPYLVAIGIFRASGAMQILSTILSPITGLIGIPSEILPMGIMRSLSGGVAEGMLSELMTTYGADSQIGRMASIAMGSTETTMYAVAVYFGAVSIKETHHTIPVGLIVDFISLIVAVFICNLFFGY